MPNKQFYAVEMLNITKVFFDTIVANNNITLKVKKGEIHALVGENGAGKSTLMSILFGIYQPTKGNIKINGSEVAIVNSIAANKLGIGMVHQHFKLVENFSVLENIVLGAEPVNDWNLVDYKLGTEQIKAISQKYKLNVNLNAKISETTVGTQQRVEILKVLYRKADIIVLDEPTAMLTPQEIEGLLTIIKELKTAGKTIIFISHKLKEVAAIADTITIIRNGSLISSFPANTKSSSEIASLMVGREIVKVKNTSNSQSDVTLLKIENLNVKKLSNETNKKLSFFKKIQLKNKFLQDKNFKITNDIDYQVLGLDNFNLEIKAGEIVAIAGVEGNGQQELVYCLTGLAKPISGKITFAGENITKYDTKQLYQRGLSYIPEDRHKYALVLDYTVLSNIVLQDVSNFPFSRKGILRQKAIQSYAQKIINNFNVKGSQSGFSLARTLSGGNQQKTVVGRELTRNHKLLVVAQPTRGLDIGAIEYIHEQILKEKEKGNAVLLVSYELGEVMALADRIVVLHSGQITGNVIAKTIKRESLGLMMAGQKWEESGAEENAKNNLQV